VALPGAHSPVSLALCGIGESKSPFHHHAPALQESVRHCLHDYEQLIFYLAQNQALDYYKMFRFLTYSDTYKTILILQFFKD
jgi:hypothetical protein